MDEAAIRRLVSDSLSSVFVRMIDRVDRSVPPRLFANIVVASKPWSIRSPDALPCLIRAGMAIRLVHAPLINGVMPMHARGALGR